MLINSISTKVSFEFKSLLESVIPSAQNWLRQFSQLPEFIPRMEGVFGNHINHDRLTDLAQVWGTGDFSQLPAIEVRSASDINGANGAYARATNTIYLSQGFLSQNQHNIEAVTRLLLEEIGHAIDAQLNLTDNPGDEGAIFAAVVRGDPLTVQQLQVLKLEDDTATVTIDGQVLQIEQAIIEGTPDNDFRQGTDDADTINLYAGNDAAYGDIHDTYYYFGNDEIYGGDGNDEIYGEYPQALRTIIDPGSNDYINGGNGDDALYGDSGDTDIFTFGNDTLIGGNGNDRLFGYGFNDSLEGGEGDDFLYGGVVRYPGNNRLIGGAGNDTLVCGVGDDWMDGGEGFDVLDYSIGLTDGVNVDLEQETAGPSGFDYLGSGFDHVANFEEVRGSKHSDRLIGNSSDNALYGDYIEDPLFSGSDFLEGGLGNDTLVGGGSNDTASYFNASSSVTVNLDTGTATGGDGNDTLETIESIVGSNFDDTLIGNDDDNALGGSGGNDRLEGSIGNDGLYGGTDDDTLLGQVGNDVLRGEQGDDSLDGGEGDDDLHGDDYSLTAESSGNDTLLGETGNDTLHGGYGADSLDGGADNDQLNGNQDNDTLVGKTGNDDLSGGIGNDRLEGGDGNDLLYGQSLNLSTEENDDDDVLLGEAGNDKLYGDIYGDSSLSAGGNDYLDGGEGDDVVRGGGGDDTLTGGIGNDTLDGDYFSGSGIDHVVESADTNFILSTDSDFASDARLSGLGNDLLINIEVVNLRGGNSDNVLDAGAFKFGTVTLSGEEGNDTLKGGNNNDTLTGVNSSSSTPGLGEIDSLIGGSGADRFILGDAAWLGYDDNDTAANGSGNYASISDFVSSEDIIQLQGPKSNYLLEVSGSDTRLLIDKPATEPDELIAIIQGVTDLDLNASYFDFIQPMNTALTTTPFLASTPPGNS